MRAAASALLVSVVSVLAILAALGPDVAAAQQPVPSQPTVIFVVWAAEKGKEPPGSIIDPLVVIEGPALKKPPAFEFQNADDPKFVEFEKNYYRAGQTYPLLTGGSARGTLTVEKPVGVSCSSMTAAVELPVVIPEHEMALAITSSGGLGLHANWRRHATPEERAAFLKLAAGYLQQNGVAETPVATMEIESLYWTKLHAGGLDSLIGDLKFKNATGIHYVFLVATKTGGDYGVALASHHVARDEDDADVTTESFVDQLDLDNDGVDEIVTIFGYYESWEYAIYKLQNGSWQKIYQGGGGGC